MPIQKGFRGRTNKGRDVAKIYSKKVTEKSRLSIDSAYLPFLCRADPLQKARH